MFKATVVASKLREHLAHYFEMVRGDEVIQILHRGGEIKVLMTQTHYLNLLSRLALVESSSNSKTVPPKSTHEIEKAVRAKLREHEKDGELRDSAGRVERKRARQA